LSISIHWNLPTRHETFRSRWAQDSHFLFFLQTRNDGATNQLLAAVKILAILTSGKRHTLDTRKCWQPCLPYHLLRTVDFGKVDM
jgi:hypothetical protein